VQAVSTLKTSTSPASPLTVDTAAFVCQVRPPSRSRWATVKVHDRPLSLPAVCNSAPGSTALTSGAVRSSTAFSSRGHLLPTQCHTSSWARRRCADDDSVLRNADLSTGLTRPLSGW
jgi:hypothetical protein